MRTICLPEALCVAAEQKFSHRFASLHELLTVLLEDITRDEALKMDEQEQRIIEERLKALGYV